MHQASPHAPFDRPVDQPGIITQTGRIS